MSLSTDEAEKSTLVQQFLAISSDTANTLFFPHSISRALFLIGNSTSDDTIFKAITSVGLDRGQKMRAAADEIYKQRLVVEKALRSGAFAYPFHAKELLIHITAT